MADLVLAAHPRNLRADANTYVEHDVYDICNRIREIDGGENLVIHVMRPGESRWNFVITDIDKNGNPYTVYGFDELDARVVEELRYITHVPHEERYAAAERRIQANEAAQREAELDRLYETMGGPMLSQLERTGFIQRGVSYSPMNKTARRHGRRVSAA